MKPSFGPVLFLVALVTLVAACGRYPNGRPSDMANGVDDGALSGELTPPPTLAPGQTAVPPDLLTLRIAGEPNGEFAAALAADDQGFWARWNLEVALDPTGPDATALAALAEDGGPEMAIAPVSMVLQARVDGADLVAVAQLGRSSGLLLVSPAGAPVADVADLGGKRATVEVGHLLEARAAIAAAGIDPADVELSEEPVDAAGFLAGAADAAFVTRGDGYAQILEQDDGSGAPLAPTALTVVDLAAADSTFVGDVVVARGDWLADPAHASIAARVVAALVAGASFCRDQVSVCGQYAVDAGAFLPLGHQSWLVNETNRLRWPAPDGLGAVDPVAWKRMAGLAAGAGADPATIGPNAFDPVVTTAAAALVTAAAVDAVGASWVADPSVSITLGGE